MAFPAAFAVGDAVALAVQIINLPALRSPFSIFPQGPDGQHDMGVGVAGSFVMDGKVSTHSSVHKIVFDESPDKCQLLRW